MCYVYIYIRIYMNTHFQHLSLGIYENIICVFVTLIIKSQNETRIVTLSHYAFVYFTLCIHHESAYKALVI